MQMTVSILRGDIFYVRKYGENPVGAEQWPGRPAVIVSNDINNRESDCVEVVYLTGNMKPPLPTHVKVIAKIPSTALCEQVTTVSKQRLGEYVKSCTKKEMDEIDKALAVSLGINNTEKPATPAEGSETERAATDETKSFLFDGEKTEMSLKNETQIRLETERDLNKRLYEDTLEKLIK